ncbi:hypothetical protein F511_30503 [Dorcoceras hygrometricum]|uniref:Uncharacterized protein n=1 Tax=Dorcoceras hygrometricum TaxID=472368 RepID=A0A2Z7B6H5_9LAMI|nr:hypothetical protein F511_30503 [Dorcoceras hygrometricum]
MQHAIINAMKCMRAIKDRIAKPVYQLVIISIEPLYHAQQVSWWKSSVRDLQDPHDNSVGQSQRGSQSADSTSTDSYKGTVQQLKQLIFFLLSKIPADTSQKLKPAEEPTNFSVRGHSNFTFLLQSLIQGFKWVAIERATLKESSATKIAQKSSAKNGGNRRK